VRRFPALPSYHVAVRAEVVRRVARSPITTVKEPMPSPVSHVLSSQHPTSTQEELIALKQEQYNTLPSIIGHAPNFPVTSRWTFTSEERAAIAAGRDIWITLLTFGGLLQPILVRAEEPTLEECLHVEL
jgi:hypothetical protein